MCRNEITYEKSQIKLQKVLFALIQTIASDEIFHQTDDSCAGVCRIIYNCILKPNRSDGQYAHGIRSKSCMQTNDPSCWNRKLLNKLNIVYTVSQIKSSLHKVLFALIQNAASDEIFHQIDDLCTRVEAACRYECSHLLKQII